MTVFLYLVLFLFGFLIPVLICFFALFNIIGDFLGAPYVPTSDKILDEILKEVNLKKGQYFFELGSGDGRVTRMAVKKYLVRGVAIDINPTLAFYARVKAFFGNLKEVKFLTGNLFNLNLQKADVIFLFLLPKTLIKLKPKITKECRKGVIVIAHGFKIVGWEEKLIKKQTRTMFSTYFYKI